MLKSKTPEHARRILAQYFPDVTVASMEEMPHTSWGGDSDVFLVNGETVFRFPRSPEVAQSLQVELCLLPQLAPQLPLPIPRFQQIASAGGLPVCAGYPLLRGEPLHPRLLLAMAANPRSFGSLAQEIGAFLTALHTFPTDLARSCGLVDSPYPLIERIVRQNAMVRSTLYPFLEEEEQEFLNQVFRGLIWELRDYDPPPVLCHGDLSSDHLLLSPGHPRLAGVIDFGDMSLGDPAGDFAWRAKYGDSFFFQVLHHYHGPVADQEQFARVVGFRCQLLPTVQMAFGLETGDQDCFQEGRRRLGQEQERAGTWKGPWLDPPEQE